MSSWSGSSIGVAATIRAIEELTAVGVQFTGLNEAIDTGTPTGRLMLNLLGAFAQFERDRITERVVAGSRAPERTGSAPARRRNGAHRKLDECAGLSRAAAAERLGVPVPTVKRCRQESRRAESGSETSSPTVALSL